MKEIIIRLYTNTNDNVNIIKEELEKEILESTKYHFDIGDIVVNELL